MKESKSLVATNGYLIVREIRNNDKTQTGLELSSSQNSVILSGEIISSSMYMDNKDFNEGQVVFFAAFNSQKFMYDGVEFIIVHSKDIYAVEKH